VPSREHRLSTVGWSDRIITIERGRLIEDGTHVLRDRESLQGIELHRHHGLWGYRKRPSTAVARTVVDLAQRDIELTFASEIAEHSTKSMPFGCS
jgi:hypothetical protein